MSTENEPETDDEAEYGATDEGFDEDRELFSRETGISTSVGESAVESADEEENHDEMIEVIRAHQATIQLAVSAVKDLKDIKTHDTSIMQDQGLEIIEESNGKIGSAIDQIDTVDRSE